MARRPRPFLTPAEADRIRRLSEVHPHRTVCAIAGVASSTLARLKQSGFKSRQRALRPVPSDWALVAPDLISTELQVHYRAGPSTIKRWFREKPVARPRRSGTPASPVPDDLAATLAQMSQAKAAEHYGVSKGLVIIWRRKTSLDLQGQSTVTWEQRYRDRSTGSDASMPTRQASF